MTTPSEDVASYVEDALHTWVYPERKRLTELGADGPLTTEAIVAEISRLTEGMANTLRVDRASVWLLSKDKLSITCVDLFERGASKHSGGTVIPAAAAPEYFKALTSEQVIPAHDARTDPRTSEFTPSYLTPLGITSMLDAPVFVEGRLAAVVCHEHIGPARRWQAWEVLVAGQFADMVGTVFEVQRRQKKQEKSPEAQRTEAVIRDLVTGEEAMRALLESSPVPLVLTSASDHRIVYANRRAQKMFEVDVETMSQFNAAAFWVDAGDRTVFLERVLRDGRIEDFETRVRSRTGQRYWVRLSAEAVRFKGELALLGAMVDITRQKRAEDNLRTVFAHAPVALVLSRLGDQTLLDGNQYAERLFEIDVAKARGMLAPDFWAHPEDRERLRVAVKEKGSVSGFEAELKTHSGKRFWSELSAALVEFDGGPALFVGGHDISVRKELEQRLWKMATTDGLTGIANRRHFFEQAQAELVRSTRYKHATTVAMLDLDHFKRINDQFGHDRGDEALKAVVAAVKPQLRETDVFARYGGEEFCIMFPETPLEAAMTTLERVRAAVEATKVVTVSIGAAQWEKEEPLDSVLRKADVALYEAKKAGRNRVQGQRSN